MYTTGGPDGGPVEVINGHIVRCAALELGGARSDRQDLIECIARRAVRLT